MDVVLPIPPVTLDHIIITGAGIDGYCAPDTASKCIGLREPKGY